MAPTDVSAFCGQVAYNSLGTAGQPPEQVHHQVNDMSYCWRQQSTTCHTTGDNSQRHAILLVVTVNNTHVPYQCKHSRRSPSAGSARCVTSEGAAASSARRSSAPCRVLLQCFDHYWQRKCLRQCGTVSCRCCAKLCTTSPTRHRYHALAWRPP